LQWQLNIQPPLQIVSRHLYKPDIYSHGCLGVTGKTAATNDYKPPLKITIDVVDLN
jgi:hypothetical protein